MSKELYFTDGNNEVKYLDTTASFNLAITQDGSAFDLTNATAIDVKVANDTGYVFDKSIDMTTIKQPLAGLITMPVDAEVMNALVPDDYTIEVWVTLSSLITPGSQEGLTDTSTDGTTTDTTTSTTTDTTTYNAIFPSDDPQGFTITENVMSDSGDVIPVMSMDEFKQEFDQLKTDLTNQVSTLQGPKGDTGPQGPQGPAGKDGTQVDLTGYAKTTDVTTAISTATANMVINKYADTEWTPLINSANSWLGYRFYNQSLVLSGRVYIADNAKANTISSLPSSIVGLIDFPYSAIVANSYGFTVGYLHSNMGLSTLATLNTAMANVAILLETTGSIAIDPLMTSDVTGFDGSSTYQENIYAVLPLK